MLGRSRIRVWGIAVLLSVSLTMLAGFGPAGAGAPASTGWRVVASTRTIAFSGLVAQSRHSVWALGGGFTLARPQSDFAAGLHWNGRTWSKVTFPKAISNTGIGCAGASSATNVWAFAGTTNSGGLADAAGALRLDGGQWKLGKRFPAGIVTGCLVESPSGVWGFGGAPVGPGGR